MNAPLNTSVILAIAVALWLIWVAPFLLRLRKRQSPVMATAMDDSEDSAIDFEPMKMTMYSPGPQEAAMTGTNDSMATEQRTVKAQPFKIKYDRLAIALAGGLAASVLLIGAVLQIAGVWSIWVPVLAFMVLVASVATLRGLAVRDRKNRVEGAFRAAMGASPEPVKQEISASKTVPVELKPAELFDAQRSAAPESPAPLTAAQLRSAALAVADGAQIKSDGTWEPVAVPKPSYVEAAKVERAAPAPLDLPEQPKPMVRTSIKKTEAAVNSAAENKAVGQAEKNAAALNNLDDVLQRRRA